MKPFGHPGPIGRSSDGRREYQACVVPLGSGGELVLDLASAVLRQGAERSRRQVHRASATRSLGLDEDVAAPSLPLERTVDDRSPGAEVDVAPLKPQASPRRSPVVANNTHSGCRRWPRLAWKSRPTSSSVNVCISRGVGRGTVTASVGLRSMRLGGLGGRRCLEVRLDDAQQIQVAAPCERTEERSE